MDYSAKIEVLDFIIEVIKAHEKALDDIAYRLEKALERLDKP